MVIEPCNNLKMANLSRYRSITITQEDSSLGSCVNSQLITGEPMVIWERERQTWRQKRHRPYLLPLLPCFLSVFSRLGLPLFSGESGQYRKLHGQCNSRALFRGMIVYPEDIWRKLKMEVGREGKREARKPLKLDPCVQVYEQQRPLRPSTYETNENRDADR